MADGEKFRLNSFEQARRALPLERLMELTGWTSMGAMFLAIAGFIILVLLTGDARLDPTPSDPLPSKINGWLILLGLAGMWGLAICALIRLFRWLTRKAEHGK